MTDRYPQTSMIILALETAGDACSVALQVHGFVRASMTLLKPRSHAEYLVPMVVETLRRADLTFPEIDAVAVSAGPGSYTGLRIGVSTAKGLCIAHDARLIGVPTLAAYARAVTSSAALDGWVPDVAAVAIRSRRDEVYFGAYRLPGGHAIGEAGILAAAEAAQWIEDRSELSGLGLGGDGTDRVLAHLERPDKITTVHFIPSASHIAAWGREALERGDEDDLDRFEPYYLKDYIAKRPSQATFDRLKF